MGIEEFSIDSLKDELLKIVDELYRRKFNIGDIVNHIVNGRR